MTEVKLFDPARSPDSGRPVVLELHGPEGKLAVHCERGSNALYVYATGPRGGDRGYVAFGPKRAGEVLSLVAGADDGEALYGAGAWLELTAARVELRPHAQHGWRMTLVGEAREHLLACLREWAATAKRHEMEDSTS